MLTYILLTVALSIVLVLYFIYRSDSELSVAKSSAKELIGAEAEVIPGDKHYLMLNSGEKKAVLVLIKQKQAYLLSSNDFGRISEIEKTTSKSDGKDVDNYSFVVSLRSPEITSIKFSRDSQTTVASWHQKISDFKVLDAKASEAKIVDLKDDIAEARKQSNQKFLKASSIVFGVSIVIYFSLIYEAEEAREARIAEREELDRTTRIERNERTCQNVSSAPSQIRQSIRDHVASRPDFIRSEDEARLIGDCTFAVFGAFRGENAFGGTVVNFYSIRLEGRIVEDERLRWYTTTPLITHERELAWRLYLAM